MRAIIYRAAADVRRSWRATAALALIVALLGGATLAFAAGARRTASAYPRFLKHVAAPDLLVGPPGGTGMEGFYDAVAVLPNVQAVAPIIGLTLIPQAGTPYEDLPGGLAFGAFDDRAFRAIGRPKLLAGRMPRRDNEALANRAFARLARVGVGDVVAMRLLGSDESLVQDIAPDAGAPLRLTITGVGLFANQIVPFSDLDALPNLFVAPSLATRVPPEDRAFEAAEVVARPGTDLDALRDQIQAVGAKDPAVGADDLFGLFMSDQAAQARAVERGLRPLGVALGLVALVLGLVGLLVAGQAVARHVRLAPDDSRALDAVGMTVRQRAAVMLVRAALIGALGGVAAVAVAIALSPRFPIGVARLAEPDPGVDVDASVLALGLPAVILGVLIVALPTAVGAARRGRDRAAARPSRVVALASRRGLSPAFVQGARFALEPGRGPVTVPVRGSLIVAVVAVAAVVTSVTYATNLRGLVGTTERYGQGWDRMLDGAFSPAPVAAVLSGLRDDPAVVGMAAGSYGEFVVGGLTVPAVSFERLAGDINLTLLEGELADGPGEVVLGGETAKRLRVNVGDSIEGDTPTGPATLRVVGRAVFPRFSLGSFQTTGLGEGAQFAGDYVPAVEEFGIEDLPDGYESEGRRWNFIVIDLTDAALSGDGVDRVDALLHRVKLAEAEVRNRQVPTEITDYERVRDVPVLLSSLLAAVALVMLGHVLVTSVRARRRELALLATFGLRRRQLRATVAWQATVTAVVALLLGVPLGLAAGRTLWHSFASGLYVDPTPATPALALAGVAAVVVIAANLVAAVPGRAAARVRPAVALRTE